MVKKGILIAVIVWLSACSTTASSYNSMVTSALASPLPAATNHAKQYFRYYLPPSAGLKQSTQVATIFDVDATEVLMNLNVSRIVSSEYYASQEIQNGLSDDFSFVYSREGSYYDSSDTQVDFAIFIFTVDDEYAVFLDNSRVTMISIIPSSSLSYVLDHMILVMRSVEVDSELVLADYSNKEIIEYQSYHQQFFEHSIPESGSLIDMYNQLHPDDQIE